MTLEPLAVDTAAMDRLAELMRRARSSPSFDEAAAHLLEGLSGAVEGLIPGSSKALARGLVHLRSEGAGYRALARIDWIAGQPGDVAPSATVFGLMERRRHAIGVDLGTSRATDLETGEVLDVPAAYVSEASSRQRMLAREVTHVIAVPLLAPTDVLAGMASIELTWAEQLGRPWPSVRWEELRWIADVAAPIVLARPVREPSASEDEPDPLLPVLGERTRPLLRVLRVFVGLDETLLLTGPTGAGKSRLAEWCHHRSPRAKRPLRIANLLAVPETMQLAELFGWRRGAFTGAHEDHVGHIEAAESGTLFLDEIDKLSMAAQAALLRLLETRRYAPLGGAKERVADVRFVVGTNADLPALVRAGTFREDLYYRINVLPVHLPALRERRDEIAGWASVMLARRQEGTPAMERARFDAPALEALAAEPWPGNLRQLENVVRRAYALWLAARTEGEGLTIDRRLVNGALATDGAAITSREVDTPREALTRAAEAIVDAAIARRNRAQAPISLAALDVLRAAVLRSAVARTGSAKDAYLLFGGDAVVQSRNQNKELRRELSALEAFEASLDDDG